MSAVQEKYWFSDNFLPVTDEVTAFDLPVIGRIPEALEGRILRIGPNPVGSVDPTLHHWMMGAGMVHGVRLRGGKAVWYRNRWVRSPAVAKELGEPTRPGPGIPVPLLPGGEAAPNTNVLVHAGRTYALEEGGLCRPYELTYELETVGPCDLAGTLSAGYAAHPKRHPATGEMHAVLYNPIWGPKVEYSIWGLDGRIRHIVEIDIAGFSVVHETSITDNYVLIYDLPMIFSLDRIAETGLPIRYDPDYPARVGVLPADGDANDVTWFEIEPCAMYHALNAFEDGERIVVDVVRHPGQETTALGFGEGFATLDRWTFDRSTGKTTEERLDDRPREFPRLDDRRTGRPHRFGYFAALGGLGGFTPGSTLLKHDLVANRVEARDFGPGRAVSEPVFVATGPDAAEDDGWLFSFVYDAGRATTDLYILNGQDFTGDPVAVVQLPVRVPHSFHGNWCSDT